MFLKYFILCNIIYTYFIIFILAAEVGDECVPNNEIRNGACTVMMDCEEAFRAVMKRNHHNFFRCGFIGDQEVVCCPQSNNRFGTTERTRTKERKADRECQRIISKKIEPLALYIIGGELASLGEFPHMVAIGFDRGNGYEFDCGGSVVSPDYIITAAHCIDTLDRIEPSMIRAGVVELGGNTWNEDTDHRIARIYMHPEYTRKEKYHDIALLRLETPLEFSSNLNAACLYTGDEDPTIPLTVTGWGQTSVAKERRSNLLLKANVTVVPRDRCSENYRDWRKLPRGVTEQQLCAGDPEGLHDTCQGDSGGPLQGETSRDGQYRLVGVTSFGRGCGSPIPGVYTRLRHYLDWIESIVWPDS